MTQSRMHNTSLGMFGEEERIVDLDSLDTYYSDIESEFDNEHGSNEDGSDEDRVDGGTANTGEDDDGAEEQTENNALQD